MAGTFLIQDDAVRDALAGKRRVVVFGGSFDPPHRAHVDLPREVMSRIDADAVLYVPAGRAPHKLNQRQTEAAHRLAMLRLSLEGCAWTSIWTYEVDRAAEPKAAPSYTVETLGALRRIVAPHTELRLLIGGDQLRIFHQWKDWQRIVALAEPVVMVRPPDTGEALLEALPTLSGMEAEVWRPRLMDVPPRLESSTLVRERALRGEPIADLVNPAVDRYIQEQGLYREHG